MQKDVDKFWQWVDNRMGEVGLSSYRELESRSGFAPGAIGKRKNAHKFPSVEMAEGMCRTLRVSWVELWWRAGYAQRVETRNILDPLLREVIEAWPDLDQVGREFVRNAAQLMQERGQELGG